MVVSTACAGSDAATTESVADSSRVEDPAITVVDDVEFRSEIGPRVFDVERSMMLLVDSIEVSEDSIHISARVVNLGEEGFDVGAEDTRYAPLVVLRDDLGNTYPALANEPAGVRAASVSHFELRLEGPLDPDATELTVELTTNKGLLTTEPFPTLQGGAIRWWSEAPPVPLSDVIAGDQGAPALEVLELVDRGTHLDVSFQASGAAAEVSGTGEVRATLTGEETELESLTVTGEEPHESGSIDGVLTFPGALPIGSDTVTLNVNDITLEIPTTQPSSGAAEPPFADLARLPDLINAKINNRLLPPSIVTPDA